MKTNDIKVAMGKKPDRIVAIAPQDWCNSGLTNLNLACSGHPERGLAKGIYYNYVGDSSAGKTWLLMTNMAEMAKDPKFDRYDLVFDNAENGALMDVRKQFGRKLAGRLRPLGGTRENPKPSRCLEEFYDRLDDLHASGRPYFVGLDSMDVLVPRADLKHLRKTRAASESGKEAGGSYGTDKAKINSARLRVASARLKETGSILVVISQTRHNIGFGAQFNPKTMAGGDALKFYARLQLWLSVVGSETEKFGSEKVKVGQFVRAKITKNHLSGWEGTLTFPLFKGVGIDDVGACVDYLVSHGHWLKDGKSFNPLVGKITVPEWDVKKRREDLVRYVEAMDKEDELRSLVTTVWQEIETKTTLKRKSRYE
jgi:RecA/RadA recombinase